VTIAPAGDGEIWRRRFAANTFVSRLAAGRERGTLIEQFGPFRMLLEVVGNDERLSMTVKGWKLGFVPLPRVLAPWTVARERVDEHGRFSFDVEIGMPVLGRLVRYRGSLGPGRAHAG
jgi:hypothetical protein